VAHVAIAADTHHQELLSLNRGRPTEGADHDGTSRRDASGDGKLRGSEALPVIGPHHGGRGAAAGRVDDYIVRRLAASIPHDHVHIIGCTQDWRLVVGRTHARGGGRAVPDIAALRDIVQIGGVFPVASVIDVYVHRRRGAFSNDGCGCAERLI